MHMLRRLLALWKELQRNRIEAVALVRRRRPIGENVTEMPVAACAANFGAHHSMTLIHDFRDVRRIERLIETRPARARFELVVGPKKRKAAKSTGVHPVLFVVKQRPTERTLRALMQNNLTLFR